MIRRLPRITESYKFYVFICRVDPFFFLAYYQSVPHSISKYKSPSRNASPTDFRTTWKWRYYQEKGKCTYASTTFTCNSMYELLIISCRNIIISGRRNTLKKCRLHLLKSLRYRVLPSTLDAYYFLLCVFSDRLPNCSKSACAVRAVETTVTYVQTCI